MDYTTNKIIAITLYLEEEKGTVTTHRMMKNLIACLNSSTSRRLQSHNIVIIIL